MKRKLVRFIGWLFLGLLSILAIVGFTYLVNPKYVETKVMNTFYPTVNISDEYKDKIVVEVPEVYELMQIASSLTETFQNDDNLLKSSSSYYQDFRNHFQEFENHELVLKLNAAFEKNPYGNNQHAIRMLSLNYDLDEYNELIDKDLFNINPATRSFLSFFVFFPSSNADLIEDFAKKSNFKAFYKKHRGYYTKLIENYAELCDFKGMQTWLESKFTSKYQSYRIVFSPLTFGFHSTTSLKNADRSMSQTFMFVSAPRENIDGMTPQDFEIASSRSSRVVFTEIDHNYVNPVTDQYLKELDDAMSDYKKWNGQNGGSYQSKYSTFNEYMTWGVFNLYALETYSKENIDSIIKRETDFITDRRKFIRFREFNKELIRLYISMGKPNIEELYAPIFDWMKKESKL
ncbi:DUF4932 domain-containing protein [Marivirga sp.]|uniref:DUF4932 domain-containing protein n=1 Tax=Marivirga sp. TaxID=2018662 RepID=UPI002D80EEDE|nr:DUF4932 domain-containing protein [Marivirga sp.]HET8858518.1 DUF4932 domain-containing protein [Marivirga sp.]